MEGMALTDTPIYDQVHQELSRQTERSHDHQAANPVSVWALIDAHRQSERDSRGRRHR
jgi:hypothetical protein